MEGSEGRGGRGVRMEGGEGREQGKGRGVRMEGRGGEGSEDGGEGRGGE